MKYFNSIIGICNKTIGILSDLESLGCPKVKIVHVGDDIRVNFCELPTYADVIDWLMDMGYCIWIEPCSTYASSNHNAWWWELNTYSIVDAYEKKEFSDTDMYCNWDECADAAIRKAIELIKIEQENSPKIAEE